MHILLIGNGGREHALAWKLAQSPQVSKISVAPGSAAIVAETSAATRIEQLMLDIDDHQALCNFAVEQQVHLTVVGPELPLVAGIVDAFETAGLRILGPRAAAAQLEGSKAYAKEFMQRHSIPTAAHATFQSADKAHQYIDERGVPIVVKADGLAAGKGVVVAQTLIEAHAAVDAMLSDHSFGDAGATVVIEEFLAGEEASFIALVDGQHCLPFATSQDHKARNEGDTGPNTGGMGAYSPAPVVTSEVEQHILQDIVEPSVAGLNKDGTPFKGFLYVGLMIDSSGAARVVEYNVRLGDPETQPLLMRLNSDLLTMLDAAVDGKLDKIHADWNPQCALGVVLAAGDYPASSGKGDSIKGIDEAEALGCKVFHAGTKLADNIDTGNDKFVTNGGRILCVSALGDDIVEAKKLADKGAAAINFSRMHYRRDIGYRAVARLTESA